MPSNNDRAMAPDVSVLMTVLDGQSYLQEAIESIFGQQTQARWELIVVDDGSTDNSVTIVEQYCALYPHCIRLLQHPAHVNRGISASRNLALRHARSPLIAFLDCDDIFLPHHLSTQMAILKHHHDVAMVYASAERWVDHELPYDQQAAECAWWGANYIPPLVPQNSPCGVLQPGTLLRWMLQDESLAPCMCTVVMRTAAARAVNGFEDEFHGLYDDQVFHAKLSSRFPVFAHCTCTARYRQHATSCCTKANQQMKLRLLEAARFAAWVKPFREEGHRRAGKCEEESASRLQIVSSPS